MKYMLFLFGLLLLGSCSQHGPDGADTASITANGQQRLAPAASQDELKTEAAADPDPDMPMAPEAPAGPQPTQFTDRKIIRKATLDFKVTDFRASTRRITALVQAFNGFISDEQEVRENDRLRNQMTIRVPAAQLDRFVDTLLRESVYTQSKSISAEDVTKRFVDTEARVRSQKATEERYRQLLKQARNVKEVLEVEEQLRAIREDVEIQEAELRAMKNDVSMSTINLTFYEDTEAESNPESSYLSRFWTNIKGGFGLISGFFLGLAYVFPLFALLGGLGWGVTRWVRSRKQRV